MTATINITPITNLVTTEAGGTAQFSVVLSEQPTKSVKIPVRSSDVSEATIDINQLVFTKGNWNQAQRVTVKGVSDAVTDGNQPYSIVLGPAKGDKLYKNLNPPDVSLVNQDSGPPAIQIVAGNNLKTNERGTTTSFTVQLSAKPTANVTIPFYSTNTHEGTVTASVTFTPLNWNQPKTITITGVNDSVVDGDQGYQIMVDSALSADSRYAGLSAASLAVTNVDNDVAGLQISPTTTLSIFEGYSKDVSVKLRAQPTGNVVVNVTPTAAADQVSLHVNTLTFTPTNWNVPQTIRITGMLGDGVDGNQAYALALNATSTDVAFNNLATRTISATIIDTDNQPLAGEYIGSYSGSVTVHGFSFFPQNGDVAFAVSNDVLTVTEPDDASGTITNWNGTFAPTSGSLVGAVYTGMFTQNADGSVFVTGTWTYSHDGNTGLGIWSATKPAPTAL